MNRSDVIIKLVDVKDVLAYGAKAINLQKLINMNFNVPNGICLHTNLSVIKNTDNNEYKDILNYIESNLEVLVPSRHGWAVRSSATIEDSRNKSYAGQFSTVIVSDKTEIKDAIEYVLNNNTDIETDAKYEMGIIIQEFIEAEWSGVGFSCNPVNGDSTPVIELCEGRGESIVDGKGIPWKYISGLGWQISIPKNINQCAIDSIIQGLEFVASIFGYEVDMEWAIKDNTVYWLQVRPITAISCSNDFSISSIDKKKLRGEWTLLDQCYKPMTPIIESLDPNGFFNSENWDTHLINHFPYFRMRPSKNLQQPREYNIGEILSEWEKVKVKYEKEFDVALNTEVATMQNCELYKELKSRIAKNREFTRYYMDRGWMFTRRKTGQKVREYLRRFYSNPSDVENELARLSSGLNTITAQKSKKIGELIAFGLENPDLIPHRVEELESYANEWVTSFKQFINEFGYLTPCSAYFHFPTLKENPEVMFYALHNMISGNCTFSHKEIDSSLWKSRMHWIRSQIPNDEWVDFNKNLMIFRECLTRTENDDYLLHKGAAQVRMILLEIGRRLKDIYYIEEVEDIFFLNDNEIEMLIKGTNNTIELAKRINYRKREFERAEKLYPPSQIFNGNPISNYNNSNSNSSHVLTGTPASSGIAEGVAFVIKNPLDTSIYSCIPNNAIIIADLLVPGMIQNIVEVGAIVTELGGFLSHGAIWAREMQIPAVVGVEQVRNKINTGDKIVVDAVRGEIRIIN